MKKFYLWFVIIYPFILSNARMLDSIPGYNYFSIATFFPRTVAIIVWIFVITCFYFLYGLRGSQIVPNSFLIGLFTIGTIGGLFAGVEYVDVIQGVVIFLFPFLIFNTIIGLQVRTFTYQDAIRIMLKIGLFNVPVALIAFFTFRDLGADYNPDDVVNGFFSDSHQYSVFFIFLSLLFLSSWFYDRNKKNLIGFLFAAVFSYFGFNEKAFLLFLFVLSVTIIVWFPKYRLKLLLAMIVLIVIGQYVIGQKQDELGLRIDLLSKVDIKDIPLVDSYLNIPEIFLTNPSYLLLGAGWGGFGTPIAYSRIKRSLTTSVAEKYNYFSLYASLNIDGSEYVQQSALEWTSTLFVGFIIESGIIGSILFFIIYARLMRFFFSVSQMSRQYSNIGMAALVYLILILLLSFVSTYTSFDDVVVIMPPIVLGALIMSENIQEKTTFAVIDGPTT